MIKENSEIVFTHLFSEVGRNFVAGKSIKSVTRNERRPSAKISIPSKKHPNMLYHDFATNETYDCIGLWEVLYNVDNKTAIQQIKSFLNLDSTNFKTWSKIDTKFLNFNVEKYGKNATKIPSLQRAEMEKSCTTKAYKYNPLFAFLGGYFDDENLHNVFLAYHTGTSKLALHKHPKTGESRELCGTVFWHVDICGAVRYANVLAYHNGKRFGVPFQPEMHKNKGLTKPFFGEHLLAHPKTKRFLVYIVESEKTAILGAIACGYSIVADGEQAQNIFLASGGAAGITAQKVEPIAAYLKKADMVILLPDADKNGRKGYSKGLEILHDFGVKNAVIDDVFSDLDNGYDLGDLILENANHLQVGQETSSVHHSDRQIMALLNSKVFDWQVTPVPYGLGGDALISFIVENCQLN